jgi:phospholipid/cholesterol/gamma-HCH transport system substrate-binding protein
MKFKKQVAIEVVVGLFTVAIIAALLALTTVLSEELFFKDYTYVEVVFDSINGLRTGDEVNARGVTVGKVKKIALEPDGVHIFARLDVPVHLREDYKIIVKSGSVLGGNFLSIQEGSPEMSEIPLDGLLRGSPSAELLDTATKTVQDIQKALNEGILADIKASMAEIRKITTSLGEGEGALGILLGDPEVKDNIQQIVANVRTLSDALAKGEGTVGKLVMDDEVYQQLQDVAANLQKITDGLARGEGTLGRLLAEDDQVYKDLAATMANVRGISDSIAQGKGSMGKLLSDEALYLEFQSLLREGRAAVDDMRETSPITTFTSIFFGAF